LAELAEAEGRALRRAGARLGAGLVLMALAGALAAGGLLACLWALHRWLEGLWGPEGAALATGAAALAVAGALAWQARRLVR